MADPSSNNDAGHPPVIARYRKTTKRPRNQPRTRVTEQTFEAPSTPTPTPTPADAPLASPPPPTPPDTPSTNTLTPSPTDPPWTRTPTPTPVPVPANAHNLDPDFLNSVKNMPELQYRDLAAMFPYRSGPYPFGSLELGIRHLEEQKVDPANTDDKSRDFLAFLEKEYEDAAIVKGHLNADTVPRRYLSKSEETKGPVANRDSRLESIAKDILWSEVKFYNHRMQKEAERQRNRVSKDLLEAIEQANKATLINTLGDYYGALCKDFKDDAEWKTPGHTKEWSFLGYTKYSDLISAYDQEQESIKVHVGSGVTPATPITSDLKQAYDYLGKKYKSVEELVSILRAYAERNITVHPVKQCFDEGDKHALHSAIMRDYKQIKFLGEDGKSEALKEEVQRVLDLVKKTFFDNWDEESGKTIGSFSLKKLRENFEAKLRRKDPFFGKKGFGEEQNIEKGKKTREKSLAEEKSEMESHSKDSAYLKALNLCESGSQFVKDVLKDLKEEVESLRKECNTQTEATQLMAQKYNKAVKDKTDEVKKQKEKIKKKSETIAELQAKVMELEQQLEEKEHK